MPRVLVTTDRAGRSGARVLFDEQVRPIHLSSGHAATQFIERLGWAISDAEDVERVIEHR